MITATHRRAYAALQSIGRMHESAVSPTELSRAKSTYLANMILHETTHCILDLAKYTLQWDGWRDHRPTGLMQANLPFSQGSSGILEFDEYTINQMRAAMGHEWAWY